MVDLAQQFLQSERFPPVRHDPRLIPLLPGQEWEDGAFHLSTCASLHPVPGLCYRFTDRQTGAVVAITGDTAYSPAIVEHVRGASLLIHEASYSASPAPQDNPSQHSGAPEAARVAREAGVRRLFLDTLRPADGETVVVD